MADITGTDGKPLGFVAGVYSMAQQVGTAIGLAAFTIIAVAYAHGSVHVTDRLHGLQIATLDTAALALGTAVFAALALPRRTVTGIAVRSGAAQAVKAGGGHKRWIR